MSSVPFRPANTTRTTARALLSLQLVVLATGVLQFAFAPNSVERPLLAAATLAALTAALLLLRIVPEWRRRDLQQHGIDVATMLVAVTLLAAATGAARSALVALYLAPLAGAAIAFARAWLVLLLAALIAGFGFALGAITPQLDIRSVEFGVSLLSMLAPGTAISLLLAALAERMQAATQRIRDLAATDALTGLLNLHAFENVLQQEHRKAERFGRTYSVVMVDIDNLDHVNETLGHDAGSHIINAVAAAIVRSIRSSDVAARLAGDEFAVLVEADTDRAAAIAQRIRNNVYAGTVSVANRLVRANVSVGVATFPLDHLYPKELMILAAQRMQQDRDLRRDPNDPS
jgi:diguanylate cyclase (GGDEF)-like protein